jgi:hypothetical protein
MPVFGSWFGLLSSWIYSIDNSYKRNHRDSNTVVCPKHRVKRDALRDMPPSTRGNAAREEEIPLTILNSIEDKYRAQLGHIGFCKWGKGKGQKLRPLLIVSPLDLPEGPIRREWLEANNKVRDFKTKSALCDDYQQTAYPIVRLTPYTPKAFGFPSRCLVVWRSSAGKIL